MLRITNLEVERSGEATVVSALLDDYRLFFKLPPDMGYSSAGDAFLAAAFFPAMLSGRDISVCDSIEISSRFLAGLPQLQTVFSCWYPKLQRVQVFADNVSAADRAPSNPGVASFFSGGIDGLYTVLKHKPTITDLVFINGFDFEMPPEDFDQAIARNRILADKLGCRLVCVETNFWAYMNELKINRPMNHGSCLASIGQILGYETVYVPSTYSYNNLHAWGSHPLTDHLWSTEVTQFIHDGAEAERTEKTEKLARSDPSLFEQLVVCWRDPNENCGECSKCQRTMACLKILGVDAPSFPYEITLRELKRIWIIPGDKSYWEDNIALAEQCDRPDIASAIRQSLFRFRLRQVKNFLIGLLTPKKRSPEPIPQASA
ncbi:MAG: hypothetical protein V2J10_07940 [Wenzhouxiangella sp.]|jgi:hypothetical protein|nr:hypothetical protein [Wenzhouxiangella sp.]